MLAILGWSFEQSLVSAVGNRTKAPILVTSAFAAGGYRFAPMSQEVMRQIGRIPGVALVVADSLSRRLPHFG
jgi:hypothetical protein